MGDDASGKAHIYRQIRVLDLQKPRRIWEMFEGFGNGGQNPSCESNGGYMNQQGGMGQTIVGIEKMNQIRGKYKREVNNK